jgi:hypothetical protein
VRRSEAGIVWAAILLGTRVPFLPHGYGLDADAWRVADTARTLIETGSYAPSRLPGYPVHEFATALLVGGGPWLVNGASAVMSVIAAGLFGRYVQSVGFRRAGLGAWALAMTPTVFVHSVSAMDHVWSLAFLMGALLCVHAGRDLVAGLLLGLAIGCRLTSAVMVLPLGILALRGRWRERDTWLGVARLAGAAVVIGGLSYVPIFAHSHGLGFLTFRDRPAPWSRTLFNGTIGVWGVGGAVALVLACAVGVERALRGGRRSPAPRAPSHAVAAWAAAIVVYGVGFLRVPFEPAYLIPAVPFVLLIAFRYLPDRAQDVLCIGLVVSPFVLGLHKTDKLAQAAPTRASIELSAAGERLTLDALQGPIVNDLLQRRNRAAWARDVLDSMERLPKRSVLVAGWLAPELRFASDLDADREIVELLSAADGERFRSEGRALFYLPGSIYRTGGSPDASAFGALPLPMIR